MKGSVVSVLDAMWSVLVCYDGAVLSKRRSPNEACLCSLYLKLEKAGILFGSVVSRAQCEMDSVARATFSEIRHDVKRYIYNDNSLGSWHSAQTDSTRIHTNVTWSALRNHVCITTYEIFHLANQTAEELTDVGPTGAQHR